MAKLLPEPDLSGIGRMQRALLIKLLDDGSYFCLTTDDNNPGQTDVSVKNANGCKVAGSYMSMFHKFNERFLLVHSRTWKPTPDVTIVEYIAAPEVKELFWKSQARKYNTIYNPNP